MLTPENNVMTLHHRLLAASAIALAIGATVTTNAQALERHYYRQMTHRHMVSRAGDHLVSRGGDVVVHTGRSYLDPGPGADIGTENRYFYDTAHYDLRSEGPAFTRNVGGFELLPTPLNPPGRPEPLAEFN
jgi:hypothetical protein